MSSADGFAVRLKASKGGTSTVAALFYGWQIQRSRCQSSMWHICPVLAKSVVCGASGRCIIVGIFDGAQYES